MEAGVPPSAAPVTPSVASSGYPIRYDVEYKEKLSRLSTLLRAILVIPQAIVLGILGLIAYVLLIISWFAIVFTGNYPRGCFNFITMVFRWSANVNAYMYLFRDEYPPFSGDPGKYPVSLEIDYPDHSLSRLTTLFRVFMVIPQMFVLAFVGLLSVLVYVAWFAIVFTGRYPRGIFDLLVGLQRWQLRVGGYYLLLTDKYPPFSLD